MKPFRILHLSDLHFGPNFFLRGSAGDSGPESWARALVVDLGRALENGEVFNAERQRSGLRQFDLLVASGDLTCYADPDGFTAAKIFFALVQGKDGERGQWWAADRLLLIPGNHDMFFGDKPKQPAMLIGLPKQEREAAYRRAYRDIVGKSPPTAEWLGLAHVYRKHKLVVIGLDSCRLESWATEGMGFVGCDQVIKLCEEAAIMRLSEDECAEPWHMLAFLHHHLTPMTEPGARAMRRQLETGHTTLTFDAEEVRKSLQEYGVDFILHGHFHRPDIRESDNHAEIYGRVLSAGSASVRSSDCSAHHHFFVLEIDAPNAESDPKAQVRRMNVQSFDRGFFQDIPQEWTSSRVSFPFHRIPQMDMTPAVMNERLMRVKSAVSQYETHGSWGLAQAFLTKLDTPEFKLVLPKVEREFSLEWNEYRNYFRNVPASRKAFDILMLNVEMFGKDLLEEFAQELDSEEARPLANFLVSKTIDWIDGTS